MRLHAGMPEAMSWEVYLDGELLLDCTEASDESGIAFVIDRTAEGLVQRDHSFCQQETLKVINASDFLNGKGIEQEIHVCDCPVKTKMLRGRVEFRRRRATRHVWVSPSKEDNS